FVRSVSPEAKPKEFKGNKPEVVKAAADGSLVLSAKNAEIYGNSIRFEEQYANLGYWNGDDDHASWTADVPKGGSYAVWLDWACPKESAGKAYVLKAGGNQLFGKVAATGDWDTYKQVQIGTIVLPAGQHRFTVRAAGKLYGNPMLDLRSIKLVPVKE